jgi:hypothetical protein
LGFKDRYQNAGHEIDHFGANLGVDGYDYDVRPHRQVQKL